MQQMFTSASDITSNPGNAALGYSGGVNYALNPADTNPGAVTQSVIGAIAQTEERKRIAERARQQEEQDKLAAYLAGTGESVFNMKGLDGKSGGFDMLPSDREYINEQTNEIRNKIISDPDKYKFDAGLQSKIQEFNQAKNLAGIRATEVAKRKVLASQTNDMREREKILQSIDEIEKEPIYSFKTPKPYLPSATWDIAKLGVSTDALSGKDKNVIDDIIVGTEKDANGNEVVITRPGIRASILDIRNRLTPGSAEFVNAENMVKAFYADPSLRTPENIIQINSDIDDFNTARGLQVGDANYVPRIGNVYGDGSVELPPLNPKSIADISYALLAQKAGQLGVGKEIKKTKSELDKEKSAMKVAEGNLAVSEDDMRLKWAKFKQDKDTLTKAEQDRIDKELRAENEAVEVFGLLTSGPQDKDVMSVLNKVPQSDRSGLSKTLLERGVDPKDYNIATLPLSDITVKNVAAIQAKNENGIPIQAVGKATYGFRLVPKDGDYSKALFIFGYEDSKDTVDPETGEVKIDKKTKSPIKQKYMEWESITPQEAIATKSHAANNFSTKSSDVIERDTRAAEYLKKIFGKKSNQIAENAEPEDKETPMPAKTPEYATFIMDKNKEKNFVKRYLNPDKSLEIKNSDGSVSTHRMASSDNIVFPMIVQKPDGNMYEFEDWKDAYNYAIKNKEFIEFPTEEYAQWFAENGYKKAAQQKSRAKPKEYIRTGKEIVGPELSSIKEEDMKEENGVRMYRYNGKWRKVVSQDEKKRLLLE